MSGDEVDAVEFIALKTEFMRLKRKVIAITKILQNKGYCSGPDALDVCNQLGGKHKRKSRKKRKSRRKQTRRKRRN